MTDEQIKELVERLESRWFPTAGNSVLISEQVVDDAATALIALQARKRVDELESKLLDVDVRVKELEEAQGPQTFHGMSVVCDYIPDGEIHFRNSSNELVDKIILSDSSHD